MDKEIAQHILLILREKWNGEENSVSGFVSFGYNALNNHWDAIFTEAKRRYDFIHSDEYQDAIAAAMKDF